MGFPLPSYLFADARQCKKHSTVYHILDDFRSIFKRDKLFDPSRVFPFLFLRFFFLLLLHEFVLDLSVQVAKVLDVGQARSRPILNELGEELGFHDASPGYEVQPEVPAGVELGDGTKGQARARIALGSAGADEGPLELVLDLLERCFAKELLQHRRVNARPYPHEGERVLHEDQHGVIGHGLAGAREEAGNPTDVPLARLLGDQLMKCGHARHQQRHHFGNGYARDLANKAGSLVYLALRVQGGQLVARQHVEGHQLEGFR
mmetsp:Transcript_4113/g.10549  ORF Transcript_4113/g.10549 Transcript_4113/m.10549 type:complete len:262 (-) Transcript_4113:1927-2712(-)